MSNKRKKSKNKNKTQFNEVVLSMLRLPTFCVGDGEVIVNMSLMMMIMMMGM